MKKIIIIEENGNVFEKEVKETEYHASAMKTFCQERNIDVCYSLDAPYLWGIEIAKEKNIAIQIDQNLLIVYLPFTISSNQFDWFQGYKTLLEKYSIHLLTIEFEDGNLVGKHYDSIDNFGNSFDMISLLYQELKKRSSKNKVKRK